MGKTRVYELAKELNLSNKEVVQRLQEIGVTVKSHSSTIEDYQVQLLKDRLEGKGAPTGQTVIRRRKKAPVQGELLVQSSAFDEEAEGETLAPDASSAQESIIKSEVKPEAAEAETPDTSMEAAPKMIREAESPAEFKAKVIKRTTDTPAKVIFRPEAVSTVEEVEEVSAPSVPEVTDVQAQAAELKDAEEQQVEAQASAQAEAETEVDEPTEKPEAVAPARGEHHPKHKAKEKPKPEPKLKRIEKTTVEPAKIIFVPEPEPPVERKPKFEPRAGGDRPSEPRPDQRGEGRPDPRREPRREMRGEARPDQRGDARPDQRGEARPDQRGEARPDQRGEARPDQRGEARPDRRGETRTEGRPRPFVRPQPDFKPAMPQIIEIGVTKGEEHRKSKKKKKAGEAGFQETDASRKRGGGRRREVIEQAELYDAAGWERPARGRKGAKPVKKQKKTEITVPKAHKRRIKIADAVTIAELAKKMSVKSGDIIKQLMTLGIMASMNQAIDFETASVVSTEFGFELERGDFDEVGILQVKPPVASDVVTRPPVVTVMGHVDHGKTSLLDAIRKTNVIQGEAGGITQHIGAYHVMVEGGAITFLDTPGHEAFTAMRARGAQVTDIVVLVVAADDGVMQQTREAVDHARAAKVPIIVAVNKIDKPEAEPDRIRRELSDLGLVPEAWGGDAIFVDVSAKQGSGIENLLEMILLQAEVLELKAPISGRAVGHIVEARLDKGRGPVATVLIQSGLLKQGDSFVCGVYNGRIRAMFDDKGRRVDEAGPSIPVEIQGIAGVPGAGDEFVAVEDDKQAKQVSQHRLLKQRETDLIKSTKLTLENLFDSIKEGAIKELNLILKADVQGSLEAIADALQKLCTDEIKINLIHASTGSISDSDIMLASASNALIIGFNVRPNVKVQELAEQEKVQIRFYDIIYKLIDDVKEAMTGMLEPIRQEVALGRAEVRDVFSVTKVGTIAGSGVTDGKIVRGAKARLLRDDVVVYDGRIISLRRFKDDVKEVLTGYECGIGLENFNDVKVGDVIEAYMIQEIAATLN